MMELSDRNRKQGEFHVKVLGWVWADLAWQLALGGRLGGLQFLFVEPQQPRGPPASGSLFLTSRLFPQNWAQPWGK